MQQIGIYFQNGFILTIGRNEVGTSNKGTNNYKFNTFFRKTTINIKNFFRKIWKALTQKITVMLVPHSENGSFHFRISFLTIFIALLIFTSVIIAGVFAITENVSSRMELQNLLEEHMDTLVNLDEFQESVPRLRDVYYKLNQSVQNLNEASGNITLESEINPPQLETEYLIKRVLESDVSEYDEITELLRLEYGIEKLIPEIDAVASYLENYKKIFDVIPSINPIVGKPYIISDYGWRYDPFTKKRKYHYGIDMKETPYSKIRATASGKVIRSRYSKTAGNYIEVQHEYGFSTRYLHLAKILVSKGQTIKKGQVIGLLGNTGRSAGPHLHYEVRVNKQNVNPSPYLRLHSLINYE